MERMVLRLTANEKRLPQYAQRCSSDVDSDDDELAAEADFDNRFGGRALERVTLPFAAPA